MPVHSDDEYSFYTTAVKPIFAAVVALTIAFFFVAFCIVVDLFRGPTSR